MNAPLKTLLINIPRNKTTRNFPREWAPNCENNLFSLPFFIKELEHNKLSFIEKILKTEEGKVCKHICSMLTHKAEQESGAGKKSWEFKLFGSLSESSQFHAIVFMENKIKFCLRNSCRHNFTREIIFLNKPWHMNEWIKFQAPFKQFNFGGKIAKLVFWEKESDKKTMFFWREAFTGINRFFFLLSAMIACPLRSLLWYVGLCFATTKVISTWYHPAIWRRCLLCLIRIRMVSQCSRIPHNRLPLMQTTDLRKFDTCVDNAE